MSAGLNRKHSSYCVKKKKKRHETVQTKDYTVHLACFMHRSADPILIQVQGQLRAMEPARYCTDPDPDRAPTWKTRHDYRELDNSEIEE